MLHLASLLSIVGTFVMVTANNSSLNQTVWNITCNYTLVNNTNTTNCTELPERNVEPHDDPYDAAHYVQVLACVLIMVVGFVGNIFVIMIFIMRWSLLKSCEVLMISLAVADFLGTFSIPLDRLRELLQLQDEGSGDFWGCQITTWLAVTCISVSSLTLVAIALDRFVVVAWPLKLRNGSRRITYGIILLTWLIGGAFGLPHFVHLKQNYAPIFGFYCLTNFNPDEERKYTAAVFVLQLVIPLLSMAVLYSFIVFKLRSGSVSARRLSETDNVVRIRTIRQRKATKLFIVVVIVFTVLVLPFNMFMMLLVHGHIPPTKENRKVYNALALMLAANSCVNPVIYSRLHKSFRKSTLSLLFGCCIPKYYKYEWESKFVSRSSFRRRRRGTDPSTTRNTMASLRKSPSPIPEDLATQCASASTPPRTLSAVSSRSSRLSSAGSDDVFLRKPSVKASTKNEDNSKLQLQKIPEVNSSCGLDASNCSSGDLSPEPRTGKYIQFKNRCVEEENDIDAEMKPVESTDIKLHCFSPPQEAKDDSSEGSCGEKVAVTNKLSNNGYTSLNGVPQHVTNGYLNDTEL